MTRLVALFVVAAVGAAGCAAQVAGGGSYDDEGAAAIGTLELRMQDLRNSGPYFVGGVRSRLGASEGWLSLRSGRLGSGYAFRKGIFCRCLGAEIGGFMAYGHPSRAEFDRPGYQLGVDANVLLRVMSTEDRRQSAAVLLRPVDLVLTVDAGRWWGSRIAYQSAWTGSVQVGLRISFTSDLLFNRN